MLERVFDHVSFFNRSWDEHVYTLNDANTKWDV